MSTEQKSALDYRWVAEKFGLFIAPAVAYYLVFSYESAYCRTFGIPPGFIRPDLTTILIYTSVVLGSGVFIAMLIDAWVDLLRAPQAIEPFQHAIRLYLPFIILLLIVVPLYWSHWQRWIWTAAPIISMTAVDFLLAAKRDKEKPFLARLQGPAALLSNSDTVWNIARKRLDLELVLFFVAIFVARLISIALGEGEALNQRAFLVPSAHPDSVLVRVYGDKILCASIDPTSKKLTKQFYILTAGQDTTLHFDKKDIGPLTFE